MKKNIKIWLTNLFVLLFFIIDSSHAQNNKILLKNLEKIQKKSNLVGFSVALIRYDSLLFSNGFGFADKSSKTKYTLNTIQPIGSISKTFIGLALMKAIELGYFDLETDINEILPFQIKNPNFPKEIIKIKHLVTHTSSLIDNNQAYFKAYNLGNLPNESLVNYLKNYYFVDGKYYSSENFASKKPGSNYSYSNIASALVANLIEIKAKSSFDEFTSKYIFDSIKMNHTNWFYSQQLADKYATLYEVNKPFPKEIEDFVNKNGEVRPYACATYPDGSLKTTTNDLIDYVKEILAGMSGKSKILTKQSYLKLTEKQFSEANMPENMPLSEPNRAIFWGYNRKGKLVHTGGDIGLSTFISIDPNTKIGRIILINTNLDGENNAKTVEHFKKIIVEIENYEASLK